MITQVMLKMQEKMKENQFAQIPASWQSISPSKLHEPGIVDSWLLVTCLFWQSLYEEPTSMFGWLEFFCSVSF